MSGGGGRGRHAPRPPRMAALSVLPYLRHKNIFDTYIIDDEMCRSFVKYIIIKYYIMERYTNGFVNTGNEMQG